MKKKTFLYFGKTEGCLSVSNSHRHVYKNSSDPAQDSNHARTAYPTVMSKMLEPTELDTAISPSPLRATITLVMRSGMEVPAANIVRPIISSVIPMVSPTCKKKEKKKKETKLRGK